MEGWIKLHRCLMEKPIWLNSSPEHKTILITLLMMANHKGKEWEWKGERFKCESGQFVTSLDKIVDKSGKGITIQNVRSALKRFEKLEFLTNESTKSGRLVTIVNWGDYQEISTVSNKDTNKEVTKTQQRTNKEVTPNKNDKNDKNEKNIYMQFDFLETVKITEVNYNKLLEKWDKDYIDNLLIKIESYCIEKNKTYKNYYLVALKWIGNDNNAKLKKTAIDNSIYKNSEPPSEYKDW